MKPVIIKLSVANTDVRVNACQIAYYYSKKKEDGKIITVLHLDKNIRIEVAASLSEIDALIEVASR